MKRIKILISSLLLIGAAACDANQADARGANKGAKAEAVTASAAIAVSQKWELPPVLREVSGIVYLGNNQFACVQDEAGVIFIYDTAAGQIVRQITFGAAGDYEGIALAGTTAYVVRSDGHLFEVTNINTPKNKITEYATPLSAENNVEGLAYDSKNNRLLLALKGEDANGVNYKGVYAFDLQTKQLAQEPVFKLNLQDPKLVKQPQKKKKKQNTLSKAWQPSEIAVHPVSGDIYVTEATNPQIFILNADGSIKDRFQLSKTEFYKPEGIAFSPTGDLYISNEGKKQSANILRVQLQAAK
ncbi:SdiA-regulated domain-containing protein [Rufibacter roseus]|uniref:SdiA-regulated domain-containing protein n=1 Tax=Rufibacter roseus TaxID=1567108 RepID=A0ABW2DL89_9BACT|nr:SdiA-regulated domain-containing protein [Rufibacter roseus]